MTKTSEKYYTRLAHDLTSSIVETAFSYVEFKDGLNEYKTRCKSACEQVLPKYMKIIRLAKRGLIIEAEIVPSMISVYNTMREDSWRINTNLRKGNSAA